VSATPVPLRVADFNAENFFDDKADHPPMLGDETILTTADYQTKLAGVASILKTVNPDVILLQEIEGPEVLAALTSQPALASAGYTQRILLPGNDPRGINVAALSRIPFTKIVSHKDDKFTVAGDSSKTYKYSRDCLELHAQVNGRHVVFLGVHFKAKVDDDPQKRLAEGQHTRFLADTLRKADPGALVVILGDFNDYPTTPPINAILGATPAELFASVGSTLGAQLAWTVKSSGAPGGLALHDDQHTSPDLFAMIKPGSVTILHDTDLPKALQGVSDHAPVAATYLIK
jgi:endonuclease/exonuclease/phosphatase family metal-dependent hydrolase